MFPYKVTHSEVVFLLSFCATHSASPSCKPSQVGQNGQVCLETGVILVNFHGDALSIKTLGPFLSSLAAAVPLSRSLDIFAVLAQMFLSCEDRSVDVCCGRVKGCDK